MGRFKRLGKNTALIFIGTASSKLITFVMLPLYTRWLNVDQYGATDLITTYSSLLVGIISLSIFESIFIFPKGQKKAKQSQYFSSCMIFGCFTSICSIIICGIVVKLASKYGWHGFFIDYLWQIVLLLISSYVQQLLQQFNRAIDKMKVFAFTGFVQTVAMVSVSFFIIPIYKVDGYIGAVIIGNIAGIIYSLYASGANKYFSFNSWNRDVLVEMLKYSIPIIPNGIMWFIVNSINRPLLQDYHGLAMVGLLAIANKIPTLINQVYMIFQKAFIISAIEEAASSSYQQFYNQTLKIVVIGQICLIAIIAICSKWIVQIFTSPGFFSSWKYVPILAYGVLFTNIATYVGTNFTINRKSKYYFYSTIWAALSALILNILLIPKFAIWGACAALIISQVIGMIARIKYSWNVAKITNWDFYFWNFILAAGLISIQVSPIGEMMKLTISIGIGIIFYIKNRSYFSRTIVLISEYLHRKKI